jgi:putative hemolysin
MDPGGAQPFSVGGLAFDLGTVIFFILLASIFVAAEIALISLREGQIKTIAEREVR